MTLFQDARSGDDAPDEPRKAPRRVRIGWWLVSAACVVIVLLGFVPAPYVIEQPGPVFNTLGVDTAIGQTAPSGTTPKPVLTISGAETHPTKGALDLLTVNVVGDPQNLPSWIQVASAWFRKSKTVVPLRAEFPAGQTADQSNAQNAAEMSSSQQDATAAALSELGYRIDVKVLVAALAPGSPAKGVLKANDRIVSVDGTTIDGVQGLRDAVAKNGAGAPATLGIVRGSTTKTVTVTPRKIGGDVQLGIYAGVRYGAFPVKVGFQLADIGGPSAGQMFALGIIDKLTPGLLNGGKKVAGTGTIDNEGNVGAIGGIRQKMYGARAAGATVFLAPKSNCDEVVGHIPSGLHVYAVSTLDDSLAVLKGVSSGDTGSLHTCRK